MKTRAGIIAFACHAHLLQQKAENRLHSVAMKNAKIMKRTTSMGVEEYAYMFACLHE